MSMLPEYKEITKDDLENLRMLILPDIYEELMEQEEIINTEYICLSSWMGDTPAGVLIADLEGDGNINLLSIWTDPVYRRIGIASALKDKMTEVALELYDWEEDQYGDDILLKTMYCLGDDYKKPFVQWLEKNDFTDFAMLKEADDRTPEVCLASAEIHFFKYVG